MSLEHQNEDLHPFGSTEWIAAALIHKYTDAPDKPAEKISSVADYLYLQKLQRAIWPPKVKQTEFIWVDPPDFADPDPVDDDTEAL